MTPRKKTESGTSSAMSAVVIEVPFGMPGGNTRRHLDFHLISEHAAVLKRIGHGLVEAKAHLNSGKHITYDRSFTGDTIRWILEEISRYADPE